MSIVNISRDDRCLDYVFTKNNNNMKFNSTGKVSTGLVVYLPLNHRVLLSEYEGKEESNLKRELDYNTISPHVIMVHHYERFELQIPAGKVDDGETYLDAVNREWNEEVMGSSNYINIALQGRPLFRKEDFVHMTKTRGKLSIAHFVRVIRDPVVYSNLILESNDRYSKRILPESKWETLDTMGSFSMPIFMEPTSRKKYRVPGFPNCLTSVHVNHKDTLIRCLIQKLNCLGGNSIIDRYSIGEFMDRLDTYKVPSVSSKNEIINMMNNL